MRRRKEGPDFNHDDNGDCAGETQQVPFSSKLNPSLTKIFTQRKEELLKQFPDMLEPGFRPPESSAVGLGARLDCAVIFIGLCVLGFVLQFQYKLDVLKIIYHFVVSALDPGPVEKRRF